MSSSVHDPLSALEQRLEKMVQVLAQLDAENRQLRQRDTEQRHEIDDLKRKNELAKARVEAIILRLRALEQQEP
ncbi:MAG: TIGR02449 family protein [Pseudomonadales bacterium]|nr:TIGR02449 family protein [Pseudomonadales bacterium]